MLKSILVGLDGSPASEAAARWAVARAAAAGASAAGLTVVDVPGITEPEPTGMAGDYLKHVRDQKLLADARPRLHELATRFATLCGGAKVPFQLHEREGDPADVLVDAADGYDLLVLGRPTFFRFETQDGPDDTLDRVVRACRRAVVSVPAAPPAGRGVVVAYDGGPPAVRALEAFAASGLGAGVPVAVVSVDADAAAAARRAGEAANYLTARGLTAEPRAVTGRGHEAGVLLEQARAVGAGTLVMGAHGHGAFWEFFFGSVTEDVLDHADVVLVTHV